MNAHNKQLLSGNEAVGLAAFHCGVVLGTGYPGTPSTEILESFSRFGGRAEWSPNEKVAAEVALGVAFSNARAIVTMKHVGLNVAADLLFTAAYSGVSGGLVFVVADDPGMASSQNEQDTRRYAVAAAVPMLEPSDSQEAYDFTVLAFNISERWGIPVILRLSTRISHSCTIVEHGNMPIAAPDPGFKRAPEKMVMIPAHARPAHKRLRIKLEEIRKWNEAEGPNLTIAGKGKPALISSGVSFAHCREAAPEAPVLKLGMTNPLPIGIIAAFARKHGDCLVIEENDPYLVTEIRGEGVNVRGKEKKFRIGELNVSRVKKIISGDKSPDPEPAKGMPPSLCQGCPHRTVFAILKEMNCLVSGDIGCYTLAVLPPLNAMDTMIDMGAGITVGLGMRHALPENEARRVVSVIGDSTFIHSGITGIVEMVYNPPATGHTVVILDNGTTAMTGLQEHPATGRKLDHRKTNRVIIEDICRGAGVKNVQVFNLPGKADKFRGELKKALDSNALSVLIARQVCLLAALRIRKLEKAQE
ncbi:MAG: thiamine pyrophosphate-dependent enzyme [Kiritimatiellae bacterium]|nr:thiamine pyrophosphate-dependent enzyme [Kiritimatiellia bacterium]